MSGLNYTTLLKVHTLRKKWEGELDWDEVGRGYR